MKLFFFFMLLSAAAHAQHLSISEIKKIVTCAPPLVSHWVQEKGFTKEVVVKYGPFEITRTDVGSPDGKLSLKKSGKELCSLGLDLSPDLYLSGKDQLLVIYSYTGSSGWFSFYSLKNAKCLRLGMSKDTDLQELKKLLDENDGSKTCINKDSEIN